MFDLTLTVPELFNGRISAGSRDMAVGDITDNTGESAKMHNMKAKLLIYNSQYYTLQNYVIP